MKRNRMVLAKHAKAAKAAKKMECAGGIFFLGVLGVLGEKRLFR